NRAHPTNLDGPSQVSIRPRPGGRGKHTPAEVLKLAEAMFQSAPGPEAGRNPRPEEAAHRGGAVSIRPRPGGRGKPAPSPNPAHKEKCFNPPPARRPGETRGQKKL